MTAARPYHVGLDRAGIVAAALELSRERGLYGWSVRDLSRALAVTPSVIYHHVGGRDLLCRYVVEALIETATFPTAPAPWREWFESALLPARAQLSAVPGVAQWLILHGPVIPALLPVVDSGIESLRRAGFGESCTAAYAMLFSVAMQTVAAADERRQHADDGPRDHATMMAEFATLADASPGLSALAYQHTASFVDDAAAANQRHYETVIETMLDGLEVRLARKLAPGAP